MSITHSITTSWASSVGAPLAPKTATLTGTIEQNLSCTVAGTTTNQSESIAFAIAGLKSIIIESDQTVTIKTNSSGSPQETLTINAGVPFVWYTGCPGAAFLGDITKFFISNAGATVANVEVRSLIA